MQLLAAREYNVQQPSGGLAALDRLHADRHFIARLECLLAPAPVDHVRRITCLSYPVLHVAAVVFHVKAQETMRIGPKPARDRALHNNLLACFKSRGAMMCGYRP